MNVEYLPFFEDEFFLRASDPPRWESIVTALRDLRDEEDEEANFRGIATVLSLISLNSSSTDGMLPIIARRFTRELRKHSTKDRYKSALLALESAVERYEFKEDCPSLEECVTKDDLRKDFIEKGQWIDTNVAYEHMLLKVVEQQQHKKQARARGIYRRDFLQDAFSVPLLILLPLGLFLALLSTYLTSYEFTRTFMVIAIVLFSVQAASVYISFHFIVFPNELSTVSSSRVTSVVAALVLCVAAMLVQYIQASNHDRFVSSAFCAPLSLAQVFVGIVDTTLIWDYHAVRDLRKREELALLREDAT